MLCTFIVMTKFVHLGIWLSINQSINQSIKTHFYSIICRKWIGGA